MPMEACSTQLESLREELSEHFQRDVRLWDPRTGWFEPASGDETEHDVDTRQLGDWLSSPEATVVSNEAAGSLLGFRLHVARRTFVVAVAAINEHEGDWPLRAARMYQQLARHRIQSSDIKSQLDASMSQITNDFEQQTYLRFLAEQIEICDVTRDVEHVTRRILPRLATVLEAQSVVFVPLEREEHSEGTGLIAVGDLPLDRHQLMEVIERFEIELIRGPVVKNVGFSATEEHLPNTIRNLVLAPVEKESTSLGWLLAINRDPAFIPAESLDNGFGTVEAGLLQVTSFMLATHGRNVELFRETEALTVGMVRALVNAIEARDSYTRGHSERVGTYARLIAQRMDLGEELCERIYIAGLLHDIGKIGISDEVLRKPGRLTPEEFAEIQKHPDIGWGILQGLKKIEYLLPGVLHHHERMDGLGYPDGLVGDNIPLQARILAVADSWDAMTSARPYRDAMPAEKARAILQHGQGSQWDSQVVESFLEILPEIIHVGETYQPSSLAMPQRESSRTELAGRAAPAGATSAVACEAK